MVLPSTDLTFSLSCLTASFVGRLALSRCQAQTTHAQGALANVRFLRIGIGIRSGRAGGFAIEVSSVMVTATINDLCGKPCEHCRCPFCAINHVELAPCLHTDSALLGMVVL